MASELSTVSLSLLWNRIISIKSDNKRRQIMKTYNAFLIDYMLNFEYNKQLAEIVEYIDNEINQPIIQSKL